MHISLLVSSPTFLILTFHPKSFHAKNMLVFFISLMHLAQDFCALSISAFAFQAFFDLLNPLCIFLTFIERFTRTIMIPFAFSSFFLFLSRDIPKSFYYYTNNDCPVFHIFDLKIVRILVVCFASGGGGPTHSKKGGERGQEKITFIS